MAWLIEAYDSEAGSFSFTYDAAGGLLSSISPVGTVVYTRDPLGRVKSRQVMGQPELVYTYDAAGNLSSMALPRAAAVVFYNTRDQVERIERTNGVSSSYQYDAGLRLISLTHAKGAVVIDQQSYRYNASGSQVSRSTRIGDPLITQPISNQFNAGNQLVEFGGSTYSYDADGNLVQEGATNAYIWDSRGRLKTIVNGTDTIGFTYDFSGNLISQSETGDSGSITKLFLLDDLTNVAFVSTSDGNSHSVLSGRSLDSHLAVLRSDGQTEYVLVDTINSTMATVDETGSTKEIFGYDSFGKQLLVSSFPFQFTGRMPVLNGLYFYRARFYSANSRRFISEDPVRFLGVNSYSYVRNSPVNRIDPLGLFDISVVDTGARSGPTYGGTYQIDGSTQTYPGSFWPNPGNANPGIATGTYTAEYRDTGHHGEDPAVILNGGGPVPTLLPNPNNGNQQSATWIQIHCGDSSRNRGSAGCGTIAPDFCQQFFSNLVNGSSGTVTLGR